MYINKAEKKHAKLIYVRKGKGVMIKDWNLDLTHYGSTLFLE